MPRTGQGGQGGARQGTPGRGYVNRTDLAVDRNNSTSAATGSGPGLPTPTPAASPAAAEPAAPNPMMRYPQESPNLTDPSMRNEPITAGLSTGPGPGREVLSLGGGGRRPTLTQTLQKLSLYSSDPQLAAILRVAAPRGW